MMRGMFSAISGLKTHQVMLDVTANDIANVNTIGYKSSRMTFKDSLTQLQRGASGAVGGSGGANAAQVGLGIQLGSIDNLMPAGALQTTGNPLDVAIQGAASSASARHRHAPARADDRVHPRRQLHRPTATATSSPRTATTSSGRRRRRTADKLLQIPNGRHEHRRRPGRRRHLRPARRRRPRAGGHAALATFPNAAGLERSRRNRWLQGANSGAGRPSAPRAARLRLDAAGAVEMSNVDLAPRSRT